MYKFLPLIVSLFILSLFSDKTHAQSEFILQDNDSTTLFNNTTGYPTPYGNYYWGNKEQYLIKASELYSLGMSAGFINKIAFNAINLNSNPALQNYYVRIGATQDSSINGFYNNLNEVFNNSSYVVQSGWNEHTFSTPFLWDGSSNIIIETCFNNSSFQDNVGVEYMNTSFISTFQFNSDNSDVCSNPSNGNSHYKRPIIKLFTSAQLSDDIAVTEWIDPFDGDIAANNKQVRIRVVNLGTNSKAGFDLKYSIDGGNTYVTETYNDTLSSGESMEYVFSTTADMSTSGTYNCIAEVTALDSNQSNNSISKTINIYQPLSGTYTIDHNGNGDFNSFNEAVNLLQMVGVSGAVTFNVMAGTYNEKISIGYINGVNNSNNIVFQSNNGDSTGVIITDYTDYNNNYLVRFQGASNITFKGITFKPTGYDYVQIILFENQNHDISFEKNVFEGTEVSNTYSSASLIINNNIQTQNNIIINENLFINGKIAIEISGQDSSRINGININSNTFTGQFQGAILIEYAQSVEINDNYIYTKSNFNSYSGIKTNYCYLNSSIAYNNLELEPRALDRAIGVQSFYGSTTDSISIHNNMISMSFAEKSTNLGLYVGSSSYANIYFNSVYIDGSLFIDTASRALWLNSNSQNIKVFNNNITNFAEGKAFDYSGMFISDYNNFFTNGNSLGLYNQMSVDSLAMIQMQGMGEMNSKNLNPFFIEFGDLRTFSIPLNNQGVSITGYDYDIYQNSRNTTFPDIGAFEYTPPANDINVIDAYSTFTECNAGPSEQITVKIVNSGTANQSNFNLIYQLDGNSLVSETVGSLLSGDTLDYTFTNTIDLSSSGKYKIIIYSDLANDEFRDNDSIGTEFIIYKNINLPFYESFNDTVNYLLKEFENNESNIFMSQDNGISGSPAIAMEGGSYSGWNNYDPSNIESFKNSNSEHHSVLRTCEFSTNGLSRLRMSFNYSLNTSGTNNAAFFITLNDSVYLKNTLGDSVFTNNADYLGMDFDLTPYLGSDIFISFESVLRYNDANSPYGVADKVFIDDIRLYEPNAVDVGVYDIGTSDNASCNTNSDSLFLKIKNYGYQSASNIPYYVHFTTNDDTQTIIDTLNATIPAFGDTIFHIGYIDLLQNTSIQAVVYTFLSGDEDLSNDTVNITTTHSAFNEVPFILTFDESSFDWENNGFYIQDGQYIGQNSNTLAIDIYPQYVNQPLDTIGNPVYLNNAGSAFLDKQNAYIDSNTYLYFDYSMQAYSGFNNDKIVFSISNDCGNTWDSIYTINQSNVIIGNSYNDVAIPVGNYEGEVLHLRIDAYQQMESSFMFMIDNIGFVNMMTVDLGPDYTMCANDFYQLQTGINLSDVSSIEWFKLSSGDSVIGNYSYYMVHEPGTYYVEVTDTLGITISDTVNIYTNPLPTANFVQNNDEICEGESYNIYIEFQHDRPWFADIVTLDSNYSIGPIYSSNYTLNVNPQVSTQYTIGNIVNSKGCGSSGVVDSFNLVVHPNPILNISGLDSSYCGDDMSSMLTVSPVGGSLSGNGISGNYFYPQNAGIGTHTIQYDYTDSNSCSASIQKVTVVHPDPAAAIITQLDSIYCEQDDAVNILTYPQSGGVLSGNGIYGSNFIPDSAANGYNDITFTYTDINGCTNSDTQTVFVQSMLNAQITNTLSNPYCENSNPITITATPVEGSFSGSGMSGNSFEPENANIGDNEIIYTFYNANNCISTDTAIITLVELPMVNISSQYSNFCEDAAAVSLSGMPTGGTFSGTGVSGSTFDPSLASVGSTEIIYSYTDANSCTNSDTMTVNINALPTVNAGTYSDVCQSGSAVSLVNGTPSGGYYTGNAINSSQSLFYPSIGNTGSNKIYYNYTDLNGCSNIDSTTIHVVSPSTANFTIPSTTCVEDSVTITYTGNASNTATFNWSFDNANVNSGSGSGPYNLSWDTAGVKLLSLQVTDSSCTSMPFTNYINVIQGYAQISAVGGTTLCYGDTTLLFANSGQGYSYRWFKDGSLLANDTLSYLNVAQTGNYSCEVIPPNACSEISNTISVTVNPEITADFTMPASACAGDMVTINYNGSASTSATYNWNFDGGMIASGSGSGPYNLIWNTDSLKTVSLQVSENGCSSDKFQSNIQIRSALANITVVGDTNFCDGSSVSLYANAGNYSYEWYKNGSSLGSTQAYYVATETGSYKVKVTDNATTCTAFSDSVDVIAYSTDFNIDFTANPTSFNIPPFTTAITNLTPNASDYYWAWDLGDGNTSTIQEPTHTYQFDGTYTVSVVAQNISTGCYDTLVKQNYITCTGGSPNPCNLVAEINTQGSSPICPGDSILLEATLNQGATYQWLRDGVILNGADTTFYYAKNAGAYQVMVMDSACTKYSSPFNLNQFSTVDPIIASNGTIMPCSNDSMELYVTSYFNSYNWSTGETSQSIYVNNSGDFTVTATDVNGCQTQSDVFTVNASLLSTPEICIVGVDSLNHNIVVWERQQNALIDSFRVYKESSVANVYDLVYSAPFSQTSVFVDSNSNPIQQSYRYRISAVDTCGSESPLSPYHKTIHLTINAGLNNTWNLIWDGYKGFNFGSYRIYRGSDSINMQLLTQIPSNLSSYTDLNPPSGKVYYQIEIMSPHPCYPDSVYNKVNTNYNSSRSNTVNTSMAPNVGISELNSGNLSLIVYPNPNNGNFVAEIKSNSNAEAKIQILNSIGQLIEEKEVKIIGNHISTFDLTSLSKGVYYIRVQGTKEVLTGKVIIQ